ncbi:MAG: phage virion morphogenesis protein [Cyanobacteria bacterium P01_D01_bin.115]
MFNLDLEANTTLKAVANLVDRTRNWRPALNEAALYMERQTKLRFAREEAPDGTQWAPLAASTRAAKKLRGAPLKILVDTGILESGIAARPASDTQASVEATAGAEYGIWHQIGTKRMPARPYLGFSDEDVSAIDRIFKRHVDGDL